MEFHELRIYPTVPAQCFPQCFTLFVFDTSTGETVRIKENLQQKSGVKRVNTNILQILIRGITWSETGDPAWDWERRIHHAAECSSVKFTKIYWLFRKKTAFSPCPGWYFSSFGLLFNSLQLPVQETPHKWWNCSCWIYFSEDTAHFKGFFSLFRQLQRHPEQLSDSCHQALVDHCFWPGRTLGKGNLESCSRVHREFPCPMASKCEKLLQFTLVLLS